MIKGMRCLIVVVLCCAFGEAAEMDAAKERTPEKVWIRGCIRTAEGAPVPGVEVRCMWTDPDTWYPVQGTEVSGDRGQYAFQVLGGREYYVGAGGEKSTYARSKKFLAHAGQDVTVTDIIVVPATGSLKGRVVNADGSAASGLLYSCQSESFEPYDSLSYLATDAKGGFHLHVLPDEELVFWVVSGPNQVQMWTGVTPNSRDRVFQLDPEKFVDLAPDWRRMSDIEFLASTWRDTKVGERIALTLPDLDGRPVSLPSARFKGKVVLLNLFGTWCGGCRVEMPHLVHLHDKYEKRGLAIVTLAFERDPAETARANVRKFATECRVNFSILLGGQPQKEHVQATVQGIERFLGYPTTIFIGRDGTVKDVKVGFKSESPERIEWQNAQFEKIIVRLLNEPRNDG